MCMQYRDARPVAYANGAARTCLPTKLFVLRS